METAHALTKYRERSTYGRGSRASYQTMFPEISARWSLLEPSFDTCRQAVRERNVGPYTRIFADVIVYIFAH